MMIIPRCEFCGYMFQHHCMNADEASECANYKTSCQYNKEGDKLTEDPGKPSKSWFPSLVKGEDEAVHESVIKTLREVWLRQITTKSDYARKNANNIADAASMGWITTKVRGEGYGNVWRITAAGLTALESS